MKRLRLERTGLVTLCLLCGLILFVGCCPIRSKQVSPFPANQPKDAAVTINFNEKGGFFVSDANGVPLSFESGPFLKFVQNAKRVTELGSFSLYKQKKGSKIWLCKDNTRCLEGSTEGKKNTAVFSVNLGQKKRFFFGDADGEPISDDSLIPITSVAQSGHPRKLQMQADQQAAQQTVKPAVAKSRSGYNIISLGSYNLYKVKGSIRVLWCTPNNICTCTCLDNTQPWPWPASNCVNDTCP